MEQSKHRTDVLLSESFMYDGVIIALIISVANNIYDLGILDLANEFILILIIWYGIIEHFIRNSNVINFDIRYRLFFYSALLAGATLNTFIYKTYGISYIPIIITPMLITLLVDYEFGASAGLILSLSTAFHHHDFFMFLQLFPQVFISTFMLKNIKNRIQVAKAGFISGILGLIMVALQEPARHFYFSTRDYVIIFLNPLFSSIAVLGILPYIEITTRIYSNIGLSEITTLNHPLLKTLSLHAPGTYYHSLRVAELAEHAAESIGANSILVRACALYHDIGKVRNPEFFIENVRLPEENPHNMLSPDVSKSIIMKHVSDGIEIARKNRLPIQIELAIPQHHGTRVQKYFYVKAHEENPKVDINQYRYQGPKPKSKEMGILMLADIVEATSKSIKEPTIDNVKRIIEKTIIELFEENELDETGLTLSELKIIMDSFALSFENLTKHRIEYPTINEEIETTG
ncbi:HDIG domain-containing metalloprotein [Fervidobacterium sp.]